MTDEGARVVLLARLRAENAKLRAEIADIACWLDEDDVPRALGICEAALRPQGANNDANPPEPPGERATGHESADGGVS